MRFKLFVLFLILLLALPVLADDGTVSPAPALDIGFALGLVTGLLVLVKNFPPFGSLPKDWQTWVLNIGAIIIGCVVAVVGQLAALSSANISPMANYLITGLVIGLTATGVNFGLNWASDRREITAQQAEQAKYNTAIVSSQATTYKGGPIGGTSLRE